MKKIISSVALIFSIALVNAQDSNILISLAYPTNGIKIKTNFPAYNGTWARGYYLVNEDNTKTFFGIGALGADNNGVASFDHGWIGQDHDNAYMNFLPNGNVGIGTAKPDAKLSVNGTIHTTEVKVNLTGFPDYVFEPAYNLLSLKDVETYISKNHHLPEMPTAAEVDKDGVNLGELNKLLVKKIEELTLYLIEQKQAVDKQNHEQQQQINELKQKVNMLSKR